MDNKNKWISLEEAARYCHLSTHGLGARIRAKTGPRCISGRRTPGRHTYEWLDEWLVYQAVDGDWARWKRYLASHHVNYEAFLAEEKK